MASLVNIIDTLKEGDDWIADVNVQDFTVYGYKVGMGGLAAEIHDLIIDATITRTIDGAPTLSITIVDPERVLYRNNFLSYSITMVLGQFAYELAQIKKSGDQFTLVFEEVVVAEMRRRDIARKVAANTMSRVEFGYLLLSELPPVDFVTPGIDLAVTHGELARGKDTPSASTKKENTWTALNRIFGEVRWRFWVDGGRVFAAPDNYLIGLPSAASLLEHQGGVDDIDYDLDSGKKVQKATVSVVSKRWALPIGARVEIGGTGPDNGDWIVSEFRRSLYSKMATVSLVRPTQPLPEPPAQPNGAEAVGFDAGVSIIDQTVAAAKALAGQAGTVEAVIQFALSKEGGPYVWGGVGPIGYDCSGLVQAAFQVVGVNLPRVSNDQYQYCEDRGGAISVDEAAVTRGAILERSPWVRGDSGHIAISLGTGNETIEAMGSAYGIRRGTIHGRTFNHGARVPGVVYG